jgi:hypothetical protein
MSTPEEHIDQKIRAVFQKSGLETPSQEFTSNVMQKIGELDPEAESTEPSSARSWILGIAAAALVFIGLAIAYYFNVNILPEGFKNLLAPIFSGLVSSFEGIFQGIRISSTTVVIILGFVVLLGIERLLNKLKITRNFYLSF